jgi:hypothetical protein
VGFLVVWICILLDKLNAIKVRNGLHNLQTRLWRLLHKNSRRQINHYCEVIKTVALPNLEEDVSVLEKTW